METRTATPISTAKTETGSLTERRRVKEKDSRSPTPKFIPFSGVGWVVGTGCATTISETSGSACETTTETISERASEVEDSERQRPRRQLFYSGSPANTRFVGTTTTTTLNAAGSHTVNTVEEGHPTSTGTISPVLETRHSCRACMPLTLLAVQCIVLVVVVIGLGIGLAVRQATRMYWFYLNY